MTDDGFREKLRMFWPELQPGTLSAITEFRRLVLDENTRQNLTRMTDPDAFLFGHVADCKVLLEAGVLGANAMDLGSGLGVPGIICALAGETRWILAESEGRKADFLETCVQALKLGDRVTVFKGRAEDFLKTKTVDAIAARAVGNISLVLKWIGKCSTWNTLFLFKGPKWAEEYAEFQRQKELSKRFEVKTISEYSVGAENKQRLLIRVRNVPRGTSKK